jgi:3-oxoacyl-[acyl-carrier protein] reductase
MNLELDGRRVLVGGGSRGIGRAVAEAFVAEGARVAIAGRDAEALERACAEIGDAAVAVPGDLRDEAAAAAAVQQAVAALGGLDVAVANAGSGRGPVEDAVGDEAWRAMLDQNLLTTVHLAEAAAPALGAGGSLVFVGSIAGMEFHRAPLPYSAAKAALVRYARDLARRLAAREVRVNVVAPGNVLFPGGSWDVRRREDPEGIDAFVAREVPMGRFGTPQEIADAVLFLASPRSSFTSGAVLVVDGAQLRA